MYDYKIVKQVNRRPKPFTRFLKIIMIFFAVIFILMGITISQGFMLPGFLLVVLYYFYAAFSQKEYEYTLENGIFSVDVILGRKHRRPAHSLELRHLEVLAPNWHEAVAKYRKNGGTQRLPKFDYTSYDDNIPYYTMIITENREKIKLLLDLDDDMLQILKKSYPEKVFF